MYDYFNYGEEGNKADAVVCDCMLRCRCGGLTWRVRIKRNV